MIEPFFSTRAREGGTGLGLSIAYGFVKQTGGDFKISSVFGQGARLKLTFPLAPSTVAPNPIYTGKRVLLVEDKDAARAHAEGVLADLGFEVTSANDVASALAELVDHSYELLVCDLDLGSRITGWDVIDYVHLSSPHCPAIFLSGHVRMERADFKKGKGHVHYLRKPANIAEISDVLARALPQLQ